MESNMKNVIMLSVLALSLSNAVSAKTFVAGRLKATATVNIQDVGANGERLSSTDVACRLGYNIRMNADSIHLDFGAIACASGMNSWNDLNADLTISEGKILKGNVQVGEVLADGTAEFSLEEKKIDSRPFATHDYECMVKDVGTKEFSVGSNVSYKIRKATDGSIELSRLETRREVATTFKKESKECDGIANYSIATKVIELEAKLSK
jgi:hypothetical protein